MVRNRLLRNILRTDAFLHNLRHGSANLITASVVDGNGKIQSILIFGLFFQFGNAVLDILCQSGLITDDADFHMILLCCFDTGFHIIAEQCHKGIHFILAALPVLRGKSIDRQIFNPHIICFFTDSLHIFCPLDMSVITGHSFCLCPPSVAVQNNGYMLRNLHIISSSTFP